MEDRDSVFVPKDLSKIKTKFLFGLTRRQCLFFGLGAAVGLPVFFLLRKSVSSTAASMLMMGLSGKVGSCRSSSAACASRASSSSRCSSHQSLPGAYPALSIQ